MVRVLFLLWLGIALIQGRTLRVEVEHQFDGRPLSIGSLKYEAEETLSVTRLAYLLSEFAFQKKDGTWVELEGEYGFIDLAKRRDSVTLPEVPEGGFKAIRFAIGVPEKINHGDPAKWPVAHALNPNFNQLHWSWEGGYIFMALEGRYRSAVGELEGYVYHLANDANLARVQLPVALEGGTGRLGLRFDVKKLLSNPRVLSFEKDGASTHSHLGDAIASALVANLQSAFSVSGLSKGGEGKALAPVKPLYLPEKFTPHPFKMSRRFPQPFLPMDNPLITERVDLGKRLFNDPILSRTNTISCASCHDEEKAFTDGLSLSAGVEGRLGHRNSMPLFNLAWKSSFFWDGRANSLREQVLDPIKDHREMDEKPERVVGKLSANPEYVAAFQQAFSGEEITVEKLSFALENYLLTLTSYNSRFDRAMSGEAELSESEKRGMKLFFTEYEPRSGQYGADCFHCHGGANFSDHQFHNNGLKLTDDLGRLGITKQSRDQAVFSTPSLRNVALTAPYMHDGRFKTLEEVVAHYSGPMTQSETLDPNLAKHPEAGLDFSKEDQAALVDFLRTLTDPKYEKSKR